MAYDIKGCREGHYYLIYFSIPSNAIDELIRENHLHEDLLRFMHLVVEEVPESDEITFKQIVQIER
jgi:small subunit ribosomal protein S6